MIPMNDFRSEPEELIRRELAAMERVVRSGWYVLGREVEDFEKRWGAFCGVKHAVGVGNGMDAIELGLRALEIGPGDEIITTPMTAFATLLAVVRSGATPVLADINPETALLDPDSVRRCITPRTRGILLVHLYGQLRDMDKWELLCGESGIALLEDCAQAHGALWRGKSAGSFGRWGAFSFYPTKNLGGVGDGGALVTNREEIAQKVAMLRNYGQSERYHHPLLGMNSRLDELQAAILTVRLEWLEVFTRRRREIARSYDRGISNSLIQKLAEPEEVENHVHHLYVIRSPERDRLAAHLRERGVSTLIHYPIPLHRQEPCRGVAMDPGGLPQSEEHAATSLSIPCHPQMSDNHVTDVITAINEFI